MNTENTQDTAKEQNFKMYNPTKDLIIKKEDRNNKFYLMAWTARAKKPFANYYFANKAERETYETTLVESSLKRINEEEERKTANQATPEKLKQLFVGMIFCLSWGWEQTNVDFYQVIGIKGKTIFLRRISKKLVRETSWASGMFIANKDDFVSNDVIKKIVKFNRDKPYLKFKYGAALTWGGREEYVSWYA